MPLLLMVLLACVPADGGNGGKDAGKDGDEAEAIVGPDEVVLNDTSDGLDIEVTGGSAAGWLFGAIEPRVDIYEEGCRDDGDVCHTLDADGGRLDWVSECEDSADGSTCIAQLYWRQGVMSYVIRPTVGVGCWAWGDDAADYYDGCTITDWDPSSY